MNVFVLCTGRCGSVTFAKACSHMTNFTADHESLANRLGNNRFAFADNHIEVDNRLSWCLGKLDEAYGNDAFYVHLTRNMDEVVASFMKRRGFGIMKAFEFGIVRTPSPDLEDTKLLAREVCETATANIVHFLKDKDHQMNFQLETASDDFAIFWKAIGAEGDFDEAVRCWESVNNASSGNMVPTSLNERLIHQLKRLRRRN